MHKLKKVLVWTVIWLLIYAAVNVVPLMLIYFGMVVFYLLSELSLKNVASIPEFLESMKIWIAFTSSIGMLAAFGIKEACSEFEEIRRRGARVKVE